MLKYILAILFCFISTSLGSNSCWDDVRGACDPGIGDIELTADQCTAQFGGFPRLNDASQFLASQHIQASIQYLLISSHFNEWKVNRKGFQNYFSKLSDDSWDAAQTLIKHMTERGGGLKSNFNVTMPKKGIYQMGELEALSKALDIEKSLAVRTLHLIHSATHGEKPHDGEYAHFISEKLAEKNAGRVKNLASHINGVSQAVKSLDDPSFALYLYDTQIIDS